MTKLKNANGGKTKKNSNGAKTPKLKLWKNSKTQIVTKPKKSYWGKTKKNLIVTELYLRQSSNCVKTKNLNCDKTKKDYNCDKTWIMTNLYLWIIKKTLRGSFSKNILTPWQPMRCSLGSVLQFLRCLYWKHYISPGTNLSKKHHTPEATAGGKTNDWGIPLIGVVEYDICKLGYCNKFLFFMYFSSLNWVNCFLLTAAKFIKYF